MSSPSERQPGKIITFYSYKGGTGRSMALANIAWVLASNGYRVLVVDWDLEAPGLHRYFYPFMLDKELTASDGVINFVSDYVMAAMTPAAAETQTSQASTDQPSPPPEKWYESYANILRYATSLEWNFAPKEGRKGYVDLIPAGRQGPSYATLMNSFNWQNFYDKFGGGGFMEAVKQKMKEEYDYVLIDSRTGVSDTSGICTVQLPDILVVCFTLNRQSIDGAGAVAESVDVQRRSGSGEPIRIFPVPTRVERAEKLKLDLAREAAKDRFSSLLWHIKPEEQDLYWGRVEVNYEPFYAFEETLATFGDKPQQTSSLLASMERITSYLSDQQVTEIVPVTETERQKVLLQYARQRRPSKAIPNDSAEATDAASEFLFYFSYARTDWTDHLDKFVQDLLTEVGALVGRPAEQIGFVDVNSLSPGAEWDKQLAAALQHSRVLVPLYSPAYFNSSFCGTEFQYFLNRQAALLHQHPEQTGGAAILPVNWVPPRPPFPRAAADIQYLADSFPPDYNNNGLSYLMRLRRFEPIYQEFVLQFARRLVEMADRTPLHSIASLPPLAATPNAFAEARPDAPPAVSIGPAWNEKEFAVELQEKNKTQPPQIKGNQVTRKKNFSLVLGVLAPDNKRQISFGMTVNYDSEEKPSYVINFVLRDLVGDEFQDRVRLDARVDSANNQIAQQALERGLSPTQIEFLQGPVTARAKSLPPGVTEDKKLSDLLQRSLLKPK